MDKNEEKFGYVYLLGDTEKEDLYKIGATRGTIERRIKSLQTGNGGEIYIASYFQTKHIFFIEKWMHIKYHNKQTIGEWFRLDNNDVISFKNDCQKFEDLYNISHTSLTEKLE